MAKHEREQMVKRQAHMEKHLEAFEELIIQVIVWQSYKKKRWNLDYT